MSDSGLAPVALFAYDRPDHLARVARALAGNEEARLTRLHIFSDAAKSEISEQAVAKVRAVARSVTGFRSVDVIEQVSNQGIAQSIIEGVTNFTGRVGKIIVLEDDLLPSPYFLRYMNAALNHYRDSDEVISVHGYCYPVNQPLPETFFLRGADCWGWGTWKRGWDLFEHDGAKLLAELERRNLSKEFDFGGRYPFTQMLRDHLAGKNDSWAVRWYASAFLLGKLTLYPGSSQIQNIGADGTGFHVGSTRSFEHQSWGKPVTVGAAGVVESGQAREAFGRYLAQFNPGIGARILTRLRKLMSAEAS
jgi:hypothetical protein